MSLTPVELTRESFKGLLEFNSKQHKHTILKLTADWCRPCKTIKALAIEQTDNIMLRLERPVECYEVNVDDSIDFYAFMKQKRMVNGIPVFLFYKSGNTEYIPDDSVRQSSGYRRILRPMRQGLVPPFRENYNGV